MSAQLSLSPTGFLSTGDSNAPGNYALLDQVAALHWVKENIRAFGGDPNDVTLIGHGHGAALVNLLMISPVTKGTGCYTARWTVFRGRQLVASSGLPSSRRSGLPDSHVMSVKFFCTG